MPEYPAIECGGWTGSLVDISGSKESPKYIVEWDDETMAKVPASYIEDCEKKQLLFTMACMPTDAIEFVEGGL